MMAQCLRWKRKIEIDTRSSLGQGGEGSVHAVSGLPDYAAKIYYREYRKGAARLEKKLLAMCDNAPDDPTAAIGHRSIAWPVDVVYTEDNRGEFLGFLMPRVSGMRTIINFYNPRRRSQHCPYFNYKYLHVMARNLSAAFCALHGHECIVGDVKPQNILVSDRALVTLIDTDSFQLRDPVKRTIYRCPVVTAEFMAPELYGIDLTRDPRTAHQDDFSLAVIVFIALSGGWHPFSGRYLGLGEDPDVFARMRAGHCPYFSRCEGLFTPAQAAIDVDVFDPVLQLLFKRCFVDGHRDPARRPSAGEWLSALDKAVFNLTACRQNSQHYYGKHLAECPWCQRERSGRSDIFAAPRLRGVNAKSQPPHAANRQVTAAPQPPARPSPTATPQYCIKCGKKQETHWTYCVYCGKRH